MVRNKFSIDFEIEDLLKEAADDYIGLWEIVDNIREFFSQDEQAREQALEVVRHLILKGLQAGNLINDGSFVVWPDQNPTAIVDRIRREWIALGEDPSIGDIAWFWLPG